MRNFYRAITFTKKPLGGSFRYRDIFQIFPSNMEGQPLSKHQEHFPNILEYWVDDEEIVDLGEKYEGLRDYVNNIATSLKKQDKILSILTGLSNNLFFRYKDAKGCWGLPILKEDAPAEEMNAWETKWCLPLFTFKNIAEHLRIDKFTDLEIEAIPTVPHKLFYIFYPDLDHAETKTVMLPKTMEEMIDAYYELDTETKCAVDSAINHSVNAVELIDLKPTLSMLCSFTCLETLVSLEFRNEENRKCDSCGQLKYSISRKFKEFLLKYVATSETNKKKFNEYYSLRSKIIHVGDSLKTEKLFNDVPDAERESEYLKRIEILQIGKLAIANWLLINHRSKKS